MDYRLKAGGLAALMQAFCYVCGFAMIATVLSPGNTEGWSEVQKLEFILEREAMFQLWYITIYVLFGVALVVLAAALHGHLTKSSPVLMSIATPFGMIWAGLVIASGMVASVGLEVASESFPQGAGDAAEAWMIIGTVQDGLGGGVEIVGGIWVLLISLASLRSGVLLPKSLNWIGLLVGVAGILTIIPPLAGLGAVFGLAQIVWFIFLGVVLLRESGAQQINEVT